MLAMTSGGSPSSARMRICGNPLLVFLDGMMAFRGRIVAYMGRKTAVKRLFLIVMCMVSFSPRIIAAEAPPYQTTDGRNCQQCPKGMFVHQDCTADDPTDCRMCPEGKFQPNEWTSEKRCYNCDVCDPGIDGSLGGEPVTTCTIYGNAVCRCRSGFYWSHAGRRCTQVTPCPPGQGVTHQATVVEDTECEPCRHEAFSASSSAEETCAPCRICEEWQQQVSPCNATQDRVCQNVSVPTEVPTTISPPQEVAAIGDGQKDNIVAIIVGPVAGVVVLALILTASFHFYRRWKNGQGNSDLEGNIPRDSSQELLDENSTASSRSSSPSDRGTPPLDSTKSGGTDSLQYQSEPSKHCGATPFRDDGAIGTMGEDYGPGDETYPKAFALEPEGGDSMPVQETGGEASAGLSSGDYRQDSHDPPLSMDKIEKESAGYALAEIPDVQCASGPTPFQATPDQTHVRPQGDGSSKVDLCHSKGIIV